VLTKDPEKASSAIPAATHGAVGEPITGRHRRPGAALTLRSPTCSASTPARSTARW
jgi:hypothetical protein